MGKLALLNRWLYGDTAGAVTYRIAPSIVVRSETELLGITSPRFAIRAYLASNSFTNIRRRKVTRNQIRQAHTGKLAEELIASIGKDRAQWIADSLLAPPQRLKEQGFEFITCDFAHDYGEPDTPEGHIPFVTHIEVGGGLCAQAATFMALCLANSKTVYGIAEITKLASSDSNSFDIHGLTPDSIVELLSEDEIALSGLKQGVLGVTPNAMRQIHNALRSYCLSNVPSLVSVSMSRMWGGHKMIETRDVTEQQVFNPIIKNGKTSVDDPDYSKLPLGFDVPTHQYASRTVENTTRDHHVVVVVGASDSQLAINDPATFPFITCSIEQLFDARAYDLKNRERHIGKLLQEMLLAPLNVISAAPKKVRMPLLGVQARENKILTQFSGLLDFIFDIHDTGRAGLKYSEPSTLPCREVPLRLTRVVEFNGVNQLAYVAGKHKISIDLELQQRLLDQSSDKALKSEYYWVHHITAPDAEQKTVESLWFWDAEREYSEVHESLSGLVFKRSDNSAWEGIDGAKP